jgi:hypothetical protein
MLRVSTQVLGDDVELGGIVEGNDVDTGVVAGRELIAFVEAALGRDDKETALARQAVVTALGEPAMVDAAAVIANFQRMVRIADGTGIPLDDAVSMMTDDIREELGLNHYGSADNTPSLSWGQKMLGRVLRPILPLVMKFATKDMTSGSEKVKRD